MTTTLLIARHGNTFAKGDIIRRVGAGTDLPLVESGLKQGTMLGQYLRENNVKLDHVYSSPLKRALQTAENVLKAQGQSNLTIEIDNTFNEIDYGVDEGQPEDEVVSRIGKQALELWDNRAIVPDGWIVNPDDIISDWENFSKKVLAQHRDQTILVVTSNGTARFAPYLTGDFESFHANNNIKLSTGAVSSLTYNENTDNWDIKYWNTKPKDWLSDYNISI